MHFSRMHEFEVVRAWLSNEFNIQVSETWLRACLEWIHQESEGQEQSVEQLQSQVYDQWLHSDLAEIGEPILPPDVATIDKIELISNYPLQMTSCVDAGFPLYGQKQKLEGSENPNVQVTADKPFQPAWEHKPSRMLVLELSDGHTHVRAMEVEHVSCLHSQLASGTKLLISGTVVCRRGMLLLTPDHVQVLGGEVDGLVEENTPLKNIERAMLKNREDEGKHAKREFSGKFLVRGCDKKKQFERTSFPKWEKSEATTSKGFPQNSTVHSNFATNSAVKCEKNVTKDSGMSLVKTEVKSQVRSLSTGFGNRGCAQNFAGSVWPVKQESNETHAGGSSAAIEWEDDLNYAELFDDEMEEDMMMGMSDSTSRPTAPVSGRLEGATDSRVSSIKPQSQLLTEDDADMFDDDMDLIEAEMGANIETKIETGADIEAEIEAGIAMEAEIEAEMSVEGQNTWSEALPVLDSDEKSTRLNPTLVNRSRNAESDGRSEPTSLRTNLRGVAPTNSQPARDTLPSGTWSARQQKPPGVQSRFGPSSQPPRKPGTTSPPFSSAKAEQDGIEINTTPKQLKSSQQSTQLVKSKSQPQKMSKQCKLSDMFALNTSQNSKKINSEVTSAENNRASSLSHDRNEKWVAGKSLDSPKLSLAAGSDHVDSSFVVPQAVVRPFQTDSSSDSDGEGSHSSQPFRYLCEVSSVQPGSTLTVKAYISTLTDKLNSCGGERWALSCRINDGTASVEVDLHNTVLTGLIGFSAQESMIMRQRIKTDPQVKEVLMEGLSECQQKLANTSCLMELQVPEGQGRPLLQKLLPVDQSHVQHLRSRVERSFPDFDLMLV
ncbi:recQ-mediated genome instability protein 1 [Aplysia californica]|uniref:RecQ-mediated genome instability protein 1 n=1 Tax=Aplysia californica TaxID=6500 RepID=A0ABM0JMJ7_APLCA|nr:recQ-mediated genome instability protein 1 [Aplysia californica]